jgi:hypothetical protein
VAQLGLLVLVQHNLTLRYTTRRTTLVGRLTLVVRVCGCARACAAVCVCVCVLSHHP